MNVAVIGTGYVGLVTGVVFADLGNDVCCVDMDKAKVAKLTRGEPTIYEPGLEEMLKRNIDDGRLTFTADLAEAVKKAEVVFIAVGTPPGGDGATDLSQVQGVAKEIAVAMDKYIVIVNKSTVPVGTGDMVREIVTKHRKGEIEFDVASNPEFLREGSAIQDTLVPDRIVIGARNKTVALKLMELYAPLERPMLVTDVPSAEMIKYASNAFLATKISFINAIADLCEQVGADVQQVAKGMGFDQRIGQAFLNAGLGFGGSCFPKDTLSLMYTSKKFGAENEILSAVVGINERRVKRFCERIEKRVGSLQGKQVGMLGLAFKPNTDDMREAKSLEICKFLFDKGAKVKAYDPVSMDVTAPLEPRIVMAENAYDAAQGADLIVIVTEWNEFKLLNMDRLKGVMKTPLVFDGRNIYAPDRMAGLGFEYYSIGRGAKS